MKKKKQYQSPFIMAISVEMQGLLMTNSFCVVILGLKNVNLNNLSL